ncbi:hypothetical protein BC939DRAFT_440593 [Gamsiella multidivaricata]|uniref:uncharacterized protein n=1 Tax=Gamsiella multidivaricata TaxID=101098 RepID=UPI0022203A1B|nr:uncharacterized protein BC939DRAFT_440593 [Gamsiella multidivaricata]KAI7829792.1 hypothetical protein BC939DRAFT_440593 [Gamsiella multidivaricata]
MVGHSYFCTCLLLQNTEIVCRYFFCVMQGDSRCEYLSSLVLKRWFKEQWQDLEGFETKVGSKLLVAYPHYIAPPGPRTEDHPASTCTRIVHSLFSTESSAPQPRKEKRLRIKRHADVTGIVRELAIMGTADPAMRCKRSTTSQSR